MIPVRPLFSHIPSNRDDDPERSWQRLWREAITDPRALLERLGLGDRAAELLAAGDSGFSLRVPQAFVDRMRHGDADDPLLLQVLPGPGEHLERPGFGIDAVGDLAARAAQGVLHKYQGRALLITTGACAVHCRYCFRRHFPYAEQSAASARWSAALEYLRGDASIGEVILSGGDPLSLSTPRLAELVGALAGIPHVRRLRIHTRLPVVLPQRVDREWTEWLHGVPMQKVVVVHANHPNEIDGAVADACRSMREAGATVLNQSVLLRRINDSVDALAELSERLFDCGVLPYYLHLLDRVSGTAHFEVAEEQAVGLLEGLRDRLPGYLVPQLVRELAGASSKRPVFA
jgi:L-lysine 2,3-aminomutase